MNGGLPPIDGDLRAHLARRSTGGLPADLTRQILDAIDIAPVKPRHTWRAFSPRATSRPRRIVALGSIAAVLALVAMLVVVPRWNATPATSGPTIYPADRALTAAELATVLADPALPPNATLVASVTIDARTDVCPMNRYPTIGLVEGMGSQVCVMGAGVSTYLTTPKATGVFAFRYLGPGALAPAPGGVLGLLGEITPASSDRIAFSVTQEWPLGGKTFLVDGWLGAEGLLESCAFAPTAGDVLSPNGEDCPYDDWLSDSSTAPGIRADREYSPPSPLPTYDPLSLRGNARHVEAGGVRLIDSIDAAAPVHGVFVVRSVVGPCAGDPPTSSRGCASWRLLAKVGNLAVLTPSATGLPSSPVASITAAPPATPVAEPSDLLPPAPMGLIGSGNRPLTQDEFRTLWAADPAHLAGRIVTVKGPVPLGFECSGAAPPSEKASPRACYANTVDGQIAPEGYWAVRIGADGSFALVGEIGVSNGRFVVSVGENNLGGGPSVDELRLVDGWLEFGPGDGCDVMPRPTAFTCLDSHLTGMPGATAYWEIVQSGAYETFGSAGATAGPIRGIYLVRVCTTCAYDTILARLEAAAP